MQCGYREYETSATEIYNTEPGRAIFVCFCFEGSGREWDKELPGVLCMAVKI